MSEMRIYPLHNNTNENISDIDKQHLAVLNDCYSKLNLELSKINCNFMTTNVTIDDFNKIQDLKKTSEFIENKIKEINFRIYNKEFTLIENFNHASHKNTFKNTFLKEVIISGIHYPVLDKWYELPKIISEHLLAIDKEAFEDKVTKLKGSIKPYFSKNQNDLRRAKKLKNTDYLIESNFSAFETVCTCIKILDKFRFEDDVVIIFDNKKN